VKVDNWKQEQGR